jgi:SAM-dependent methyltransferase
MKNSISAARVFAALLRCRTTPQSWSSPMIQRASSLAASSRVTDRLVFRVGDVAALPFPDASFDVVVSTFSAHHWPDPASGLAEIYRVLRPGGAALVYDLADWITRAERRGASIAELANDSPFGGDDTYTRSVTAKFGPLPVVYRAELRRERPGAPGEGHR